MCCCSSFLAAFKNGLLPSKQLAIKKNGIHIVTKEANMRIEDNKYILENLDENEQEQLKKMLEQIANRYFPRSID